VILPSQSLYGDTETLFAKTLSGLSTGAVGFAAGADEATVSGAGQDAMRKGRVATKALATNSVDLVCTDPPYELKHQTAAL
jgi:hypothetical protein